jgi:cytosine/adenosine deaminase-related metal-dependent hydrolase
MTTEFVLTGATVLRGSDLVVSYESWIKVDKHGRVSALGTGPLEDSTITRFDASGMIICPAFLNAHTHVIDGFLKEVGFGLPFWDVFMPPDGLRHRALSITPTEVVTEQLGRTLDQMIACGTSLFVDFREGGRPGVKLLEQLAADRPIQPLTLGRFAAYPPQPPDDLAANEGALGIEALEEISGIVEEGAGFALVSANDLTDQGLAQVAAHVRSLGGLLALHVAESPPYRETSIERTGQSDVHRVVDHLSPDFAVHLTFATPEEMDRLAEAGIPAVCCPRNHAVIGLGIPRFDLMLQAGMTVAIATDNVILASPDPLAEIQFASRVIRALREDASFPTATDMLKMITINPAKILGVDHERGSIEIGKRADLVLIDATTVNLTPVVDPVAALVNRATAADIRAVFNNGILAHGRPLELVPSGR